MSGTDLAIPDGALLLHVGPQKTGSTAIQRSLHAARDTLAEHGVHYPGPGYRIPPEAGWAVAGRGSGVGRAAPRIEVWRAVVDDLLSTDLPRACLSSEGLALADAAGVDRIVADLGAEPLHLVYVCRRLDKLLPSHWQERLKARMRLSYPAFLDKMAAPDDGSWEWTMMWAPHDVAAVVGRWQRHLPPERITVVVSGAEDRDLLPRTFERLLGVPAGVLAAPASGSNRSLTYAEAEAVRRVNQVFTDHDWDGSTYRRIVQRGIVEALKAAPREPDATPVPGLPPAVLDVVHDRADAQADAVGAVAALGVNVLGDPGLLRTRGRVGAGDASAPIAGVSAELLGRIVEGAVDGALALQERKLRRAVR